MDYRERAPSPRLKEHILKEYIRCFWSLESEKTTVGEPEPVMPEGCMEIIFNLADRFRRYHASGEVKSQPASIVAGHMQTSILIGPSGNIRLFGIRFAPAGAFPFFRVNLADLANRIEPLDSVWGRSGPDLEEQLAGARVGLVWVL